MASPKRARREASATPRTEASGGSMQDSDLANSGACVVRAKEGFGHTAEKAEAAKLAQKVDKAEHKNSRAAKQASSMRRMAEEMDLPVSSDEEEEEETRHSNGRQQAREAALVVRQRDDLRRVLGKLGWPAGGAAAS